MIHFKIQTLAVIVLWNFGVNAQSYNPVSKEQIVAELNEKVAPTLVVTIEKDKALLSFSDKEFSLDLSRKTPEQFMGVPNSTKSSRYVGPIFWLYDFSTVTGSRATFELDSLGQITLRLTLNEPDPIIIKTRLNNFSSWHPTYDSELHHVLWTGEKALTLLFKPERKGEKMQLTFQNIITEGDFKRSDHFNLNKFYVTKLEERFKKELQKIFQTEEWCQISVELAVKQQ